MNDFYDWLYDRYAAPMIHDTDFPAFYQQQKEEWQRTAQSLSRRERLLDQDLKNSLVCCWGARAFAWGVHVGLKLRGDFPQPLPEER